METPVTNFSGRSAGIGINDYSVYTIKLMDGDTGDVLASIPVGATGSFSKSLFPTSILGSYKYEVMNSKEDVVFSGAVTP